MTLGRRTFLRGAGSTGTLIVAGCLSDQQASTETATDTATETATDTATETCSAQDPPAPTDAATAPRSYPDRPAELTTESLREFLEAYEKAYQYNDALAANPNKIGRTNEITIFIESVSVTSETDGYSAVVSGQFQSDIRDPGTPETTPETPTETPLPMGRGPIEASYMITDRKLRREGIVTECW